MEKIIKQIGNQILKTVSLTKKVTPLTRFGTYGFLSMILASQVALANNVGDTAEHGVMDAKKDARTARRELKKSVRKVTGNQSTYENVKDKTKDTVENTKDELKHEKHKAE